MTLQSAEVMHLLFVCCSSLSLLFLSLSLLFSVNFVGKHWTHRKMSLYLKVLRSVSTCIQFSHFMVSNNLPWCNMYKL